MHNHMDSHGFCDHEVIQHENGKCHEMPTVQVDGLLMQLQCHFGESVNQRSLVSLLEPQFSPVTVCRIHRETTMA